MGYKNKTFRYHYAVKKTRRKRATATIIVFLLMLLMLMRKGGREMIVKKMVAPLLMLLEYSSSKKIAFLLPMLMLVWNWMSSIKDMYNNNNKKNAIERYHAARRGTYQCVMLSRLLNIYGPLSIISFIHTMWIRGCKLLYIYR